MRISNLYIYLTHALIIATNLEILSVLVAKKHYWFEAFPAFLIGGSIVTLIINYRYQKRNKERFKKLDEYIDSLKKPHAEN